MSSTSNRLCLPQTTYHTYEKLRRDPTSKWSSQTLKLTMGIALVLCVGAVAHTVTAVSDSASFLAATGLGVVVPKPHMGLNRLRQSGQAMAPHMPQAQPTQIKGTISQPNQGTPIRQTRTSHLEAHQQRNFPETLESEATNEVYAPSEPETSPRGASPFTLALASLAGIMGAVAMGTYFYQRRSVYHAMMAIDVETDSIGYDSEGEFVTEDYFVQMVPKCEQWLAESVPLQYPEDVTEAMRYSLLAGGKRLRPLLVVAACKMFGGTEDMAKPTACAVEMVHTMSLMHDDLPCMDDDDLRRGKPTCHKVYGEDIAILAGDALLSLAFEYIARETPTGSGAGKVEPERVLDTVARLGRCVGDQGLVGGQVVDIKSEGKEGVTLETLEWIHEHKTAVLLEFSVVAGAVLAGANHQDVERLTRFSLNIGLAFQIIDDILDVTASSEELGKTAGKDEAVSKTTYPKLLGLEESRARADRLIAEAKELLEPYGNKATPLLALADFVVGRTN